METVNELHMPVAFDRLLLAFANLESYGIDTRILPGTDPREELDRLQTSIRGRFPMGTASCTFILIRDVDRFDAEGALRSPLPLHHSGPDVIGAIEAALALVGFAVSSHRGANTV